MTKQLIFGRAMYLDTDIKAGQLVKITSDESVSLCETGLPDGVATFDGISGDKITVELFCKGIITLEASETINAGDEITSASGGKGAVATGTGIGKALTTATTGNEVTVMVR